MKNVKFLMVASLCLVAAAATVWGDEVRIVGARSSSNVSPWWGTSFNAMRFMALWTKADLGFVRGGYIQKIEWERSSTASGRFDNVRIYFCHSSRTALSTTFNSNYLGTPVQVLNASSLTVTGTTGQWWNTGITPNEFNYNNTNNLLMEIRWRGDSGVACACYRANGTQKRMWANSDTATTGTVYNQMQRLRITIANATGVAPTSLGRVKSLFR
jgi:hypothetical protein